MLMHFEVSEGHVVIKFWVESTDFDGIIKFRKRFLELFLLEENAALIYYGGEI